MRVAGGTFRVPLAAWWPDDDHLLSLDCTHRPLLDTLVSNGWRAPIWLTAFGVDIGEEIGVRDPDGDVLSNRPRVFSILVSEDLQNAIASRSRPCRCPPTALYDWLAGPLLSDARRMIKSATATAEGVAVAALRAGW